VNFLPPRRLPEHAVIGIWAPSGALPDPALLPRAVARLEAAGHRVLLAPGIEERDGYCAGSAEHRLAALHTLVSDPAIDLVMAARGGFGLSHLLPRIDWAACAASRKLFCGFSDFTAFHAALLARTGQCSIAGPMAVSDFAGDLTSTLHAEHFWGLLSGASRHAYPVWRHGGPPVTARLRGPLWGGNLSLLTHLVGTPWFPSIDGGLLFLEDIAEAPYRVERMLLQLELAGVLARQQAILLGAFTACEPAADAPLRYTLEQVISALRQRFGGPVLTGLAFGHIRDKLALPFGVEAELALDGQQCNLQVDVFTAP
jgi:muramoyltetrapeptide carboxypeptidase